MSRMGELASVERPREKMLKYGAESLSSEELLAILIGTGRQGLNALQLASRLLRRIDLVHLQQSSPEKLSEFKGIGVSKASRILAGVELGRRIYTKNDASIILTPYDVFEALDDIRKSRKEHFVVFYLDVRNQQIKREIITIGILDANMVHPREVFEPAIRHSAFQIVVAHNHPSNVPTPSEQDQSVTQRLKAAGEILGISLLDHIIVTKDDFYSFREHHLLD